MNDFHKSAILQTVKSTKQIHFIKKRIAIIIVVSTLLIALGVVLFAIPSLSTEESYVLQAAKDIQKKLLAPHTMHVIEAGIVILEDHVSIAIHYSAVNSDGGYSNSIEWLRINKDGTFEYGYDPDTITNSYAKGNAIIARIDEVWIFNEIKSDLANGTLIDVEKINNVLK